MFILYTKETNHDYFVAYDHFFSPRFLFWTAARRRSTLATIWTSTSLHIKHAWPAQRISAETPYSRAHTHKYTLCQGYFCRRHTLSSLLSPRGSASLRQRVPSVFCLSIQYGCWQRLNFIITFPRLKTSTACWTKSLGESLKMSRLPVLTAEAGWQLLKGTRNEKGRLLRKSHLDCVLAWRATSNRELCSLTVWEKNSLRSVSNLSRHASTSTVDVWPEWAAR